MERFKLATIGLLGWSFRVLMEILCFHVNGCIFLELHCPLMSPFFISTKKNFILNFINYSSSVHFHTLPDPWLFFLLVNREQWTLNISLCYTRYFFYSVLFIYEKFIIFVCCIFYRPHYTSILLSGFLEKSLFFRDKIRTNFLLIFNVMRLNVI